MENKNPMDLPIEIINPGNGLPGISPNRFEIDKPIDGGTAGCGVIFACPQTYMPSCTLGFLGRSGL